MIPKETAQSGIERTDVDEATQVFYSKRITLEAHISTWFEARQALERLSVPKDFELDHQRALEAQEAVLRRMRQRLGEHLTAHGQQRSNPQTPQRGRS
jgi:hypothetical protein